MRKLLSAILFTALLAGCSEPAKLPDSYQPGVEPIDSTFESMEVEQPPMGGEQPPIVYQDKEPEHDDSGIDFGDVALGFVAAEVIDGVFDTRSSKTEVVVIESEPKAKTAVAPPKPKTKSVSKPKAKTKKKASKPKKKKKRKKRKKR